VTSIVAVAAAAFRSCFRGRRALVLENLALRQQVVVYKRLQKRPRLRSTDRAFWVLLSRFWDGWKTALILVGPETEIRWHSQGFKLYWRRKSRAMKIGRPKIPREHINFIRRMRADNPNWGEDKIDLTLESQTPCSGNFGLSVWRSARLRPYRHLFIR
jgi:hypothetical protein